MATLEIIVFLVALLIPASILLKRARWLGGSAWSSLALVLLVGVIGSVFLQPDNGNRQKRQLIADASTPVKQLVPRQQRENGYQTSDRCRSCHPKEHASWHHSFHRSMTQLVGPDNVLGDFNDRRLTQDGFEYVLHWEGDRLLVDMPDPDVYLITEGGELELGGKVLVDEIKMVEDLPVVMMTGSHSFQGYWVPSSQGLKLIQLPWIYNILDKRWMPSQDAFIRPPDGRKRVAVWNENCIQCHALGGNPNEIGESGVLMSTVAELGISCEACHGPAEQHVAYYQNPLNRYLQHLAGGEPQHILNPADLTADVSTQVCGQCHSSFFPRPELDFMHKGNPFRPGDELEKTHHIIHYGDEESRAESRDIADGGYWKDGTIRVGGREYNGLVMSPCYKNATDPARQVSCLSCHQMHSEATNRADLDKWRDDQLRVGMEGDQACLQCHAQYQQTEALEQHTFHAASSSGSRCYNCHMPFTSYALLKGIRGHRVTVPNV
ncbi:MAG: ammonia-forming cytochrome c nitrite reductase subunit c552, partial [Pirellulaceae bacterium]